MHVKRKAGCVSEISQDDKTCPVWACNADYITCCVKRHCPEDSAERFPQSAAKECLQESCPVKTAAPNCSMIGQRSSQTDLLTNSISVTWSALSMRVNAWLHVRESCNLSHNKILLFKLQSHIFVQPDLISCFSHLQGETKELPLKCMW